MNRGWFRLIVGLSLCVFTADLRAQFGGGGFGGGGRGGGGAGGGGVVMDAEGVLRTATTKSVAGKPIAVKLDQELAARSELRKISLRDLDRRLAALKTGAEIPVELRCLAGLVKIEYVVLDQANRDVLLVGPAEGWYIAADGRPMSRSFKRPCLVLDDLAVALRNVLRGPGEVSCSIDPTREGLAALNKFQSGKNLPFDKSEVERYRRGLADAFDLQVVTTHGVPEGSRFAHVMIEADYRMKRMAIGIEKAPGVTSHLEVVGAVIGKGGTVDSLMRWWFTPKYDSIAKSADGNVYKLSGPGLRVLNERMLVDADGNKRGTGADDESDRFAASFSKRLASLEEKYSVFADLHNLYDVMIACAIMKRGGAGEWLNDLTLLDEKRFAIATSAQPTKAEPVVTIRNVGGKRKSSVSFAYGGVSIRPGDVIDSPAFKTAPMPELPKSLLPEKPATDAGAADASTGKSTTTLGKADSGEAIKNIAAIKKNGDRFWADLGQTAGEKQ